MIEGIYEIIEQVRRDFAPDPRTAVFDVDIAREGSTLVLYGAVSSPGAAEELHRRVGELEGNFSIEDLLVRLPDARVEPLSHGIVTAATAPMLAGPVVSQSHLSQVILGHRVVVLREHGRWLQCRSRDGYVGWIHRGYMRRVDELDAKDWETGGVAPLHFSLGAHVRSSQGRIVARLPWGARFGCRDGEAILPDGATGSLVGESLPVEHLVGRFPSNGSAVVSTALTWRACPYLWGGTTPAGVDCSGLVQAILATHGVEIPRDSDQQAVVGVPVDFEDLSALKAGDLMFFAEDETRISHVALSMGGSRLIHSALGRGGVQENDLDGGSDYERDLRTHLVAVRRLSELER